MITAEVDSAVTSSCVKRSPHPFSFQHPEKNVSLIPWRIKTSKKGAWFRQSRAPHSCHQKCSPTRYLLWLWNSKRILFPKSANLLGGNIFMVQRPHSWFSLKNGGRSKVSLEQILSWCKSMFHFIPQQRNGHDVVFHPSKKNESLVFVPSFLTDSHMQIFNLSLASRLRR